MIESIIQIKDGIKINVDASAKSIIYLKMIMLEILLYIFVEMENI